MQVNELFRQSNTILLDGGMGTMLQAAGLKLGARPEELNITDPALIEGIHGQYAAAGSRIVNANTFGASAHKLAGSAYTLEQVITAGIENCKRACAPYGALTALDVGPLGELLEPSGTLAFEDAVAEYARIVKAGEAAGADLIFFETYTDLYELKAALLAAKENTRLPVLQAELNEVKRRIDNLVAAIEQGILTPSTKSRMEELEQQREALETSILQEQIETPPITREQILFWFDQFRHGDPADIAFQEKVIDCFVNSIYLFDDRIVVNFNYQEGGRPVSLEEVLSSFLDGNGAPQNTSHEAAGYFLLLVFEGTAVCAPLRTRMACCGGDRRLRRKQRARAGAAVAEDKPRPRGAGRCGNRKS